jgi:IS30 family transposase
MKEDRKYQHLSYEERSTIALGLQQGMSVRAIARALGRSPSTISRERRRNAPAAAYSCKFAHQRYQRRRQYGPPATEVGTAVGPAQRGLPSAAQVLVAPANRRLPV